MRTDFRGRSRGNSGKDGGKRPVHSKQSLDHDRGNAGVHHESGIRHGGVRAGAGEKLHEHPVQESDGSRNRNPDIRSLRIRADVSGRALGRHRAVRVQGVRTVGTGRLPGDIQRRIYLLDHVLLSEHVRRDSRDNRFRRRCGTGQIELISDLHPDLCGGGLPCDRVLGMGRRIPRQDEIS